MGAILEYESVEYAIPGLKVPINQEDEEESLEEGSTLGRAKNKVKNFLAKRIFHSLDTHLPVGLFKPTFFKSEKEVDDMVKSAFGITQASESELTKEVKDKYDGKGLLPEPLETFEDMSSDEGISQMAFFGIGQVMLKKSDATADAAYEVDLTALGELEVKEGFAKYGAKAVFDKEKKLLYIYVCTWGKNVYPPKEGTENSMEE